MEIFSRGYWKRAWARFKAWFVKPPPADSNRLRGLPEGVTILEFKVWNEPEEGCQHDYRKIKAGMSHRSNVKLLLGSDEKHEDYVCARCTHLLCYTSRGDNRTISPDTGRR